jgi:uncharacterized protein (TIGR00369 family)
MSPKYVKDSQITLSQLMQPHDANHFGNVHGGVIMKLVDETGALCAMRHAQRQVVTLAVDSLLFHSPVHVGNLLVLTASLNWVGRTSLEVGVRVATEDIYTAETVHTHSAYLVYVALDEQQNPTEVPRLIRETADEHRRWAEAEMRRSRRLQSS